MKKIDVVNIDLDKELWEFKNYLARIKATLEYLAKTEEILKIHNLVAGMGGANNDDDLIAAAYIVHRLGVAAFENRFSRYGFARIECPIISRRLYLLEQIYDKDHTFKKRGQKSSIFFKAGTLFKGIWEHRSRHIYAATLLHNNESDSIFPNQYKELATSTLTLIKSRTKDLGLL